MRASSYNILVDSKESEPTLLYNSLYGSLSLWEDDELAALEHLLEAPDDGSGSKALLSFLVKQRNLIEDSVDELELIRKRKLSGIHDGNRLDLVLLPTLDCNLACVYCYEDRRPGRMSETVESAIKAWLTKTIPSFKVVTLSWFGGEPLLGYRQLCSITSHALEVALEAEVTCIAHMTTNGYLLTESKAHELVALGIRDYQITLDGPRETHDSLRILRNGKGTFDRILANIASLARADDTVRITLRVNFNHTNIAAIPRLLESIPTDIRSQLRVVYEPIFGDASHSAASNLETSEIAEAMSTYYQTAAHMGYDTVLGQRTPHTGKLVYCYAERDNQFIINHDGDVFKCSVTNFDRRDRVGYLGADGNLVLDHGAWEAWVGVDLFDEKCDSCAYLPLCMGGCRKMRIERKGTGSWCNLVPSNTSYVLKEVAFGRVDEVVRATTDCQAHS